MRTLKFALFITFSFISCDRYERLTQDNWIIITATYENQPINVYSTVVFPDEEGNKYSSISFSENGKTLLPGLNYRGIRGKWKIDDDLLYLTIDSARYNQIHKINAEPENVYKELETDSLQKIKSDSLADIENEKIKEWQNTNPLLTNQYSDDMKIYEEPFKITIQGDVLILESKTTTFRAIKDRSIDRLFEGL